LARARRSRALRSRLPDHFFHDRGYYRGYHDRGPFFDFDIDFWRGGFWDHGWHDGRFGWWWTLGPDYYYYYPQPIYPYPDPYQPPTIIYQQAPPPPAASGAPNQQYWYYCDEPKGYYPYVPNCRTQWRPVPVTPPSEQ
jgi:hypothetical protein